MAENILMIALSPTMETGTISSWLKDEGDSITEGDVICEVETDKATMDYESTQAGTLLKIVVPEGSGAQVGQPIAIIGEKDENIEGMVKEAEKQLKGGSASSSSASSQEENKDAGAAAPSSKKSAPSSSSGAAASSTPASGTGTGTPGGDGHVKSSPLARVMADKHGIDISTVRGSGPDGRVVKRDIEKVIQRKGSETFTPETGEDIVRPVSQKRRIIAERLSQSKYQAPHYYLKVTAAVDDVLKTRAELNRTRPDDKVSFNAFLIKIVADTLKKHPALRSSWEGDSIRTHASIDIGLAVAQEDGLITPVVRNSGNKGILEINNELNALIDKARSGKLNPEEYTGAVFSISNLGSYGIEEFTAIINPPGSAILTVGALQKRQVFDDNGDSEVKDTIKFTLSCDHRVIDGAVGAQFVRDLKLNMENPLRILF